MGCRFSDETIIVARAFRLKKEIVQIIKDEAAIRGFRVVDYFDEIIKNSCK